MLPYFTQYAHLICLITHSSFKMFTAKEFCKQTQLQVCEYPLPDLGKFTANSLPRHVTQVTMIWHLAKGTESARGASVMDPPSHMSLHGSTTHVPCHSNALQHMSHVTPMLYNTRHMSLHCSTTHVSHRCASRHTFWLYMCHLISHFACLHYITRHIATLSSSSTWYTSLHFLSVYGIKCLGRIVTKSMSKICNFWRLIVGDCDYAEN